MHIYFKFIQFQRVCTLVKAPYNTGKRWASVTKSKIKDRSFIISQSPNLWKFQLRTVSGWVGCSRIMSHLFISTGMGPVSCASWGALWSGHMRPHADVCTLQTGREGERSSQLPWDFTETRSLLSQLTCSLFNWRRYMAFTSSRLCSLCDHLLGAFYVPRIGLSATDMKTIKTRSL